MPIPGADPRIEAVGIGGAAPRALRLVTIGLLVGLLFGSAPLRQWTESLPDVLGAATLHDAAVAWEAQMDRIGLTWPYATIRVWLRGIEAAPWR